MQIAAHPPGRFGFAELNTRKLDATQRLYGPVLGCNFFALFADPADAGFDVSERP